MPNISEWLVPGFLLRLDRHLLQNQPVVWRTKAHFVLFYAASAGILLFTAGFFYPVDAQHLTVDPIKPIELGYEKYNFYALAGLSFGLFYWASLLFQVGYPFTRAWHTLFTLAVYALCIWVICGITAPAFRMGMIVRTAWFWMDASDMEMLEQGGIYPNGFILLPSDSTYSPPADGFFQRRATAFREIYKQEEKILKIRYQSDISPWREMVNHFGPTKEFPVLSEPTFYGDNYRRLYLPDRSYLAHHSDDLYVSYTSTDLNIDYNPACASRTVLSDLAFVSTVQDWNHLPVTAYLQYMSFRAALSYRFDTSSSKRQEEAKLRNIKRDSYFPFHSNVTYSSSRYPPEYLPYFREADERYRTLWDEKEASKIDDWSYEYESLYYKYRFSIKTDTIAINDTYFHTSSFFNSVEDAIRSVNHARQFLQEQIFWKYFMVLRFYVFIVAFLLFAVSYLSFRDVMIGMVLIFFCWLGRSFFNNRPDELLQQVVNAAFFLALPLTGFVQLIFTAFKRFRYYRLVRYSVNMIFVGQLILLLSAIIPTDYTQMDDLLYQPYNIAFYGVQIIGILSTFLITRILALPKAR